MTSPVRTALSRWIEMVERQKVDAQEQRQQASATIHRSNALVEELSYILDCGDIRINLKTIGADMLGISLISSSGEGKGSTVLVPADELKLIIDQLQTLAIKYTPRLDDKQRSDLLFVINAAQPSEGP